MYENFEEDIKKDDEILLPVDDLSAGYYTDYVVGDDSGWSSEASTVSGNDIVDAADFGTLPGAELSGNNAMASAPVVLSGGTSDTGSDYSADMAESLQVLVDTQPLLYEALTDIHETLSMIAFFIVFVWIERKIKIAVRNFTGRSVDI